MNVLGIVSEYNPFHNGHFYHLNESKRLTDSDFVVCVMSGNFVQRGEPAIINKWSRAKAAISNGIDLVIELPFVYSISSAEYFAYTSVKLLDSLGVINTLSFGSESGNIENLQKIAKVLCNEPEDYKMIFKNHIGKGISFPQARSDSLIEYFSGFEIDIENIHELISNSNNILAIEYLKALKKLNSYIVPFTLKRLSNDYNNIEFTGSFSSATAIRNSLILSCNELFDDKIEQSMPSSSLSILKEEFDTGRGPVSINSFDNLIISALRRMSLSDIKQLPNVSEGLENRIAEASMSSGSLDELINHVCTKRYTRTRIQRIMMSILGGLTKEDNELFLSNDCPNYIKVLGFSKKGRNLLTLINTKSNLPLITNYSDLINFENDAAKRMLQIEAFSTNQYVLGYQNSKFKNSGQEFTQKIIKI